MSEINSIVSITDLPTPSAQISSLCEYKIKHLGWISSTEDVLACANYSIGAASCAEDYKGYLNIPQKLNMWVADAPYEKEIGDLSSVTNAKKYGLNPDPFSGDFVDLGSALKQTGAKYINSCYVVVDSCVATVFSPGFLRAPIPTIPYIVDTYIDTDKILDIAVTMPDVVIPDLKFPTLSTPEIKIPNIVIPDIIVPDINIPDVIVPDIIIPDIEIPDIIFPDTELNIVIPPIEMPDITIDIPTIEIPDIELPEIDINTIYPRVHLNTGDFVTWTDLKKHLERGPKAKCAGVTLSFSSLGWSNGYIGVTDDTTASPGDLISAQAGDWEELFRYIYPDGEDCSRLFGVNARHIAVERVINESHASNGVFYWNEEGEERLLQLPPEPPNNDDGQIRALGVKGNYVDWYPVGLPPLPEDGKLYVLTGQYGRPEELKWVEVGSCGEQ